MKKRLYYIEYIRDDCPVMLGQAWQEATSPRIAINKVAKAAGCEVMVFMTRSLTGRRAPRTYYGYLDGIGIMRIPQFIDKVDLMFSNDDLTAEDYQVINRMYEHIIDRSRTRKSYDLDIEEDTP